MSGSAEKAAWVKAMFGIDVDAPPRESRPPRMQMGTHRAPPAMVSAYTDNPVDADQQPVGGQPAEGGSAYLENAEVNLEPRAGDASGAESAYLTPNQMTLQTSDQPTAAAADPDGDEDPLTEDLDYAFDVLAQGQGDGQVQGQGGTGAPQARPPVPDIPVLPPKPQTSAVEAAYDEFRDTANRLADYATVQVALLVQWEKATKDDAVKKGREGWQEARKAFKAYAAGMPGDVAVPNLRTLYVMPPDSRRASRLKMAPVTLDPAMATLAETLPGKVQKFSDAEAKQSKEVGDNFAEMDRLSQVADAFSEFVTDRLDRFAKIEAAALPKFLMEKINAGKVGWVKAKAAFDSLKAGEIHTPVPDLKSLYLTPPDSGSMNRLGLPHVDMEPEVLKDLITFENDLERIRAL